MKRSLLSIAAVVTAGVLAFASIARAGDPAPAGDAAKPAAEAGKADAPKAETPKAEAPKPETKTPSPIHTMMGWLSKQVAPGLENPCPSKAEGEKAWRAWFAGGKDVPAAALRDAMVADGWTADRFVSYFQAMAKAACHGECEDGDCDKGECHGKCEGCKECPSKSGAAADGAAGKKDGCCEGSGQRADGKPCCGKCKEGAKKDGECGSCPGAKKDAPEKPAETPAKP